MLTVQEIPVGAIRPSPHNPRRIADGDPSIVELAESIKAQGLIQPITVRPRTPPGLTPATEDDLGFEIVAGERRWRACRLAGLEEIPALVRADLSEEQALEIIVVENLQRQDLQPLEEARGYQQLLRLPGQDVARIAERMGRSIKYVYDRVKLLELVEPAQRLLTAHEMSAGHAILLARLAPSEQERAIKGGLFTHERSLFDPRKDEDADLEERVEADVLEDIDVVPGERKAVSVRELQAWIDEHVRFDAQTADPMLVPETVATVARAQEETEKIVSITFEHHVQPEAKDGTRIYGPRSWKPADGRASSKECDRSVTGVIVIGPGRGEALKVCIDKKRCEVHWGKEKRDAAKLAKATAASGSSAADRYREQQEREDRQRKKQEAERARWLKAAPAVLKALADRVKKASAGTTGALGKLLLEHSTPRLPFNVKGVDVASYIPVGKSSDDLIRHLAFGLLVEGAYGWNAVSTLPKLANLFGVSAGQIVDQVAPPEKPQTSAPAKPAAAAKKKSAAAKNPKATKPAQKAAAAKKSKKKAAA